MYRPYIADILHQVDEVMKLFSMEKELRKIRNRGDFPVPKFTPDSIKIKTTKDKDRVLTQVDREVEDILKAIRRNEENYEREQEETKNRDQQLRLTRQRQTNRSDFNFFTIVNSTPIRNSNTRTDQPAVHFNTNPVQHHYTLTNPTTNGDHYEPPANDSIIQGATSVPGIQFTTNMTQGIGRNEPWRYNNGTNTATHSGTQAHMMRQPSHNSFQYNSPNSLDNRHGPTCYRCGEQGHIKMDCKERVYCTNCRSANHDIKACRKQHNNTPSPLNNHIPTGYHPTAMSPPLIGATSTGGQPTQQSNTTNNGHLFQNLFENQIPKINTTSHTPFNGASPAPSDNMTEALTQIIAQVTNDKKQNDVSKQMMKNIKIFDGTNKAECIMWLSQIEAAARFSNKPFRELICQSMAPAILHVLSELSAAASDEDIKNSILTNYSDIPSTTEAATGLQSMWTSPTEPLVTFNHRYEAIHRVAFGLAPNKQCNKTIIVEYAKKLPQNARDKLLRKIAKKNSYIRTLDDAFKQAIEINRETSFVEAASGHHNDQNSTRIDTQINELDDSFQECDINAMNTRATNRSTDGSHNGSFNRSGSRNSSLNSSYNSRPSNRNNNYSSNSDSYNRQGYNRDNNRNRGYQPNNRYDQKSQNYQNRYDSNQNRYRFDNRRRPNKYQHHRNQPKAQIIFEYTNQNMPEMLQTVRSFIDFMKTNSQQGNSSKQISSPQGRNTITK